MRRQDAPAEELVLDLDPTACAGHGLCAELFPEGIVLDDWGYPILRDAASDPALRPHARRAVRACPALALRLRAAGSRELPSRGSGSSQVPARG